MIATTISAFRKRIKDYADSVLNSRLGESVLNAAREEKFVEVDIDFPSERTSARYAVSLGVEGINVSKPFETDKF